MEDFNSKYTGQQVEDILDQVASGGGNEVYIADFTRESLRKGIYDGTNVECDMRALVDAMNANKVILVREDKDSSYKGVYVLNGYAEDLLYFSIVDTYGSILWCEGTDYINYQFIEVHSLHERNWGSKQDTLVSGENIKTINGESILGSGDIEISGGGSGAYAEVNHGTSDTTFTLTPNTFHVWDEVASLTLDLESETAGVANEFLFQFNSGSTATSLTLPDDIKWTVGEVPAIEANKIYQISILKGLASVLEFDNAPNLIENHITYDEGNMMNGGTITFEYPTASELTFTMIYYQSDTLIVPQGSTQIRVDWYEPSAPIIRNISPTEDSTYKYIF